MANKNKTKFRYFFLAALLLIIAVGLLILPKYKSYEGIKAQELLANSISSERYISTDALANYIISNDPSFVLIDVRNEKEFEQYSIKNSYNFPLDKILTEDAQAYIDQDEYEVVFISNDNFKADQAWMLYSRLGLKNIHVLKGGTNEWFNTIINPKKPTENNTSKDFEKYSFRKAASLYFGVQYPEDVKQKTIILKQKTIVSTNPTSVKKIVKKKVKKKRKKKKMPVEGGC